MRLVIDLLMIIDLSTTLGIMWGDVACLTGSSVALASTNMANQVYGMG